MSISFLQRLAVAAVLAVSGTACTQDAPRTPEDLAKWSDATLWSLEVVDIDGKKKSLEEYKGKVVVVVNVASKCGFTRQYKDLQRLHDSMKDKGVVVLGFPCNDFGAQEPGSSAEIKSFCTDRYGVEFPMFEKVHVKPGETQSDVYGLLGTQSGKLPGWNFCKYVVGRDGKTVAFFESRESPTGPKMLAVIEKELAVKAPEGS